MHINKGKTVAQCLSDRIGYAINPEKTDSSELISSFRCDYHTADAEFLLRKQQYDTVTQKQIPNTILAYQIRQSFKPGEVSPEEANKIGYETASRLLKGKHAFIVATHINTDCIHNHIIFDAVTLDGNRKWKDVLHSHKDIARISDLVCTEHQLSVILNPGHKGKPYNMTNRYGYNMTHRDLVRSAIDDVFAMRPNNLDEFWSFLEELDFELIRGRYISIKRDGWNQGVSLSSLGEGYSEKEILAVLSGEKEHKPFINRKFKDRPQLITDLEQKMRDKSRAYRNRLSVEEIKQMSRTVLFIQENNLTLDSLQSKIETKIACRDHLKTRMDNISESIRRNTALKNAITDYARYGRIYAEYKRRKFDKDFYSEHKTEIEKYKSAKDCFDTWSFPDHKLPPISKVNAELEQLKQEFAKAKKEYYPIRDEIRELLIHQSNILNILDIGETNSRERTSVIERLNEAKTRIADKSNIQTSRAIQTLDSH